MSQEQFQQRVQALADQIRAWVDPDEWATKLYPKRMRDTENQIFEIPSLFLQKGPIRLLLDPIAYDVPGSEGVVDLYLMPTYDDLASLYFTNGNWSIHYPEPEPAEDHKVGEAAARPFNEETINQVLNSIAAHATPSF